MINNVYLTGVSLDGIENGYNPGDQWPRIEAVNYFVGMKRMNVIRLPFLWESLQPVLDGPLDTTTSWGSLNPHAQVAGLQDQISRVVAAGASVILDMHNYGRRTVAGVAHIIGQDATVTAGHFADIWSKIAKQWGSNPKVIFSLMNEPHDMDATTWAATQTAAAVAIRETGASNAILFTGNVWNAYGWNTATQDAMLTVVDPTGGPITIDLHFYFDAFSAGQSPDVVLDPLTYFVPFTTWARMHKIRGFVGEFAAPSTSAGGEAATRLLHYLQCNQDVYSGWCWWGAGGWWPASYIFRLDPYGSRWDGSNPDRDASSGGTGKSTLWDAPLIDMPQMGILQPYLPRNATPFNGLTLP